MTTTVPPTGSYALAGQYAKAWFDELEPTLAELRWRTRSPELLELQDSILDEALISAGIRKRETPSVVESIQQYSVKV